jgi:hypothetical protein
LLRIRNHGGSSTPQVLWKWKHGAATSMLEIGTPEVDEDYTFCVFDQSASTPQLLFAAGVPGGKLCNNISCWRRSGRSMTYLDRAATPEGIRGLRLQSGADDRAAVQVKAKGFNLVNRPDPLPVPPLAPALRAQLQSESGVCWEATYSNASVNGSGVFKANSD